MKRVGFLLVAAIAFILVGSVRADTPPVMVKQFSAPTIPLGGPGAVLFAIVNENSSDNLNGVGFTDNLPAGMIVFSPNDLTVKNCGSPTITATPGSNTITMSGATVAPTVSGGSNACVVLVLITGTSAGTFTNTTTPTSSNGGTGSAASASITVVAPPVISKAFGAASILVNGTTSLTITISNPNSGTSLTGVAFADVLPPGMLVATPSGLASNCGGTATAAAGTSLVSLAGGSIAASSSCVVSLNIVGTIGLVESNSVQATSTNGGTGNTATASITVIAPPDIVKVFSAPTIPLNGVGGLVLAVVDPNTTVTLNGVGFTDSLPAGLVVFSPNDLTVKNCGSPTITATPGSSTISMSGATIAPTVSGGSNACSILVLVTGTVAGAFTNTTSAVTSTNAGTGNTASAMLTVVAPPSISKAFGAATIPLNTTTSLTLTVSNPNSTVALTGLAFTDSLPSGLAVATPSGLSNSCGGTATAVAGSSVVSLAGGSVPASSSCTVSLTVLGAAAGVENNIVQATSTNGGTGNVATASITVVAPPVIGKAFGAPKILLDSSTTLSFAISNPNATVSLTGVGFTDTLPAGLVIASPNGLTGTCGGGTITATAGSNSLSLSGATLAPSAFCTFTVSVTAVAAGTQVNTTSVVTSTNGGNGNTASATVIVINYYYVSYFSNNIPGAPDATVRVINDGTTGGALYAEFFVFDDSEELTQCCGCQVTPDGLLSESVQQQLTAFALRGVAPTRGVIKMFGSKTCFGGNCQTDYGQPNFSTLPVPARGLRSWATHVESGYNQNPAGPAPYVFTETPFENANLDFGELGLLESLCAFDAQLSGQPCSCTPEGDDF